MKVLLITSELTFVPDNYDDFILPLLKSPHVQGLLLVQNRDWSFALKALALIASGAAPGFGAQLLKNFRPSACRSRLELCESLGKKVFFSANPNSPETKALLAAESYDLFLHARTRSLFGKSLLALPRLGCLNIHHGLLPEQRGLMCDFWAHLEKETSGFSVHVMTARLDDGPIVKAVPVPTDQRDYLASIQLGAREEARTCLELFEQISRAGRVEGRPNVSEKARYRKNPGLLDFYRLRAKGVKI